MASSKEKLTEDQLVEGLIGKILHNLIILNDPRVILHQGKLL